MKSDASVGKAWKNILKLSFKDSSVSQQRTSECRLMFPAVM